MKIGIIGIGYWGKIILRNLESMGKDNIVVCDISFSDKNKYQNYQAFKDYKQLDCELVFITTPTSTHYEICKYFLEKKVKVFCEKPLTTFQERTVGGHFPH